jgi:ATP dependent DNA ligase C terminal region
VDVLIDLDHCMAFLRHQGAGELRIPATERRRKKLIGAKICPRELNSWPKSTRVTPKRGSLRSAIFHTVQMGTGYYPCSHETCGWVEPVLVAQFKFTEWTSDNQLRQPVFLGLRTDK